MVQTFKAALHEGGIRLGARLCPGKWSLLLDTHAKAYICMFPRVRWVQASALYMQRVKETQSASPMETVIGSPGVVGGYVVLGANTPQARSAAVELARAVLSLVGVVLVTSSV